VVVNNLVHSLVETGFSEYEARAYVALLRKSPLTAYEIAREAGIPTAKVYGVVTRLSDKGLFSVTGEGKRKSYTPLDPDEFLSGLRGRIQNTLTQIEGGFTNLARKPEAPRVHNLRGYDYLLDKAQRLISGAQRTLLVSVWKDEMKRLHPEIRKAEGRKVKAATVHFGQTGLRAGTIFSHPVNIVEDGGRSLVVVADSREALTGTVHADGSAEGVTSANSGFVSLAESYITHDIYMMKLTRRFDREFRMTFGYDYEKLRDVYSDDAHS
jgi:sugar-specific transcriptional regulator TrmB